MDRRRRVSMREVAELADVAISSVSRVLSEHPDVSDEMRTRVLEAVARLEYEPDFLAQSLRRGETRSVGFVVADISNPLFASVALGVESVLRANGYSLMFMGSEGQPALDVAHIRFLLSRRVDGLILSLASETDPATLEQLAKLEVPIVLLDRDLPAELGASAVQSDHATGMRAGSRPPPGTRPSPDRIGRRQPGPPTGSRPFDGDARGDRCARAARRVDPHARVVLGGARDPVDERAARRGRAADRDHRRRESPVRGRPDGDHRTRTAPRRGHLARRLRRHPARPDLSAPDRDGHP